MVAVWSALAEDQLNQILDYQPEVFAELLFETLFDTTNRLATFPYLGMLVEENPLYRVLIEGRYKIVYSVEEERIRIVFLFDTRQSPAILLSFLQ